MTTLFLLLLLAVLASVPLLRALQRRSATAPPLARALRLGLRFFWIGLVAGLALGLLAAADALTVAFLPFVAIAAAAAAFLTAFLFSANTTWLRLAPAERRRLPLVLRYAPWLTAMAVLLILALGLRPVLARRALATARSPQATEQELRALYLEHSEDQRLIGAISQNAASSPRLIAEMARASYAALYVLAANPKLPPEMMRELAADERLPLRRNVAANPALPAAAMEVLMRDPLPEVRAALAANPAATGRILRVLAGDPDERVRLAAAANSGAPRDLLEELSEGPDMAIAAAARLALEQQAERREGAAE